MQYIQSFCHAITGNLREQLEATAAPVPPGAGTPPRPAPLLPPFPGLFSIARPQLSAVTFSPSMLRPAGEPSILAALRRFEASKVGADFSTGNRRVSAAELSVLVGKYGCGMATVLSDRSYRFFGLPGDDAVVGYRPGASTALVPGGPVSDPARLPVILSAFRERCRKNGKQMIIYAGTEDVARWARDAKCGVVQFGAEQSVDPRAYTPVDAGASGAIRKKVKHARSAGVTVEAYRPGKEADPELEAEILDAYREWKEAKNGDAFADVQPFALRDIARFLVARQGKKVVGFLMFHELEGGKTCLIEHLVQRPGSPGGTSESLVDELLKQLKTQASGNESAECSAAVFGFEAAPHLGEISGLPWWSAGLARRAYDIVAQRGGLGSESKKAYRAKFGEVKESPAYLIFDPPMLGPGGIKELLGTFHVG